MKTTFKRLSAVLLGVAWSATAYAGHTNFDFSVDPVSYPPDPTGSPMFLFAGAHNHADPSAPDYYWQAANGNSGGFLSLTENRNNDSLIVVLPQLDFYTNSHGVVLPSPIRNFKFDVDVRIGNPTNVDSAPADGFSISFARSSDPALLNAMNGALYGWAGGASLAEAQAGPNPVGGSFNTPENGVRQGLSIVFDAHQGNYLPDTAPSDGTSPFPLPGHSNDREGITLRFDDKTLIQGNFGTANRNGACSNLFNATATNACAISGFTCTNINTLQTGPFGGSLNAVGSALLCWQHVTITLTNKILTVVWKGRTNMTTTITNWQGGAGRFMIGGRTGGDNQVQHFDNLVIDTTPFTSSYLNSVVGNPYGFVFDLQDFGDSLVTNITQVLLDGTNVSSQVVLSNSAPDTFGFYSQGLPLAPASTHTVAVTWQTKLGEVLSATNQFTVIAYGSIPDSYFVPLSAINTTQPGFQVRVHQTQQLAGPSVRYAEEQLIGLHGANIADLSGAVGNAFTWNGPIDFATPAAATAGQGILPFNNDFTAFGIQQGTVNPGTTKEEEFVAEFSTYVYFPTNGFYTFVVAGDDSHKLQYGYAPGDKFGPILTTLDVNQMPIFATPPAPGGEEATLYISHPGCLPMRILLGNVGGDGALEVYTINQDGSFSALGDPFDPNALACYRVSSVHGPYVNYANPVWDAQNVTFFQPIVVQLNDGTGNMAVDPATIVLTSATSTSLAVQVTNQVSVSKPLAFSPTTIVLQKGTYPQWTNWSKAGTITNVLSFKDLNGTSYTYTWTFNVLNTSANFATNSLPIPASLGVAASLVDTTQPGFRIRSWQSPVEPVNNNAYTEEQLEGLHGPNVADQSQTNGPGFFVWNDVLDFHYNNGTLSGGEFGFDRVYPNLPAGGSFQFFGIGLNIPYSDNPIAPQLDLVASKLIESASLDIGAWLVFTNAGNYLMQVNRDDGFAADIPQGTPSGKLGIVLGSLSGGGGITTTPAGADTGGTLFSFNIPTAGAYPFRLVYENGGTAGGLEVSIYQFLPDGSVTKVPLNDPTQAFSIRAYQTLTGANDPAAPYVKYANPISPVLSQPALDILPWQPVVVDLGDGGVAAKAVNTNSIVLKVDGVAQTLAISRPSAGVTHIVQQLGNPWVNATTHTNLLTYQDAGGIAYTQTWAFTVMASGANGVLPFGIATLPVSNSVPTSLVDHSQTGFRVKVVQIPDGAGNIPLTTNILRAEEAMFGLWGPSIATGVPTPPSGYFVWDRQMDFADNIAVNATAGEFRYNFAWSTYFGFVVQGSGATSLDSDAAIFAGWMEFPKAGNYGMVINADDGFKVTSPFGKNPFSEAGTVLGIKDGTGGDTTGGAYPPTGGARTHFMFNVPAPGAYPIRLLWYNGTGGIRMEWSLYEYLTNGAVGRVLVGEPGNVNVYQTLLTGDSPYIGYVLPSLPTTAGNNVVNNWMSQTNASLGNLQNPVVDTTIFLKDGSTATVLTNTIQLSYLGVVQPIVLTYTNGTTAIVRPAGAAPPWPSGGFGPLILSYSDSAGAAHSEVVEYLETPFWGTLTNAMTAAVDTNKPGFKMRVYHLNPQPNNATTIIPNRIHVAEQILTGLWGTNSTTLTAYTDNGYVDLLGTGPTNGVINFNIKGAAGAGDFTTGETVFFGVPGNETITGNANTNFNFACEILAYVEFPTNGTYTLAVASDDGFRLTSGWTPPANIGALTVNSPAFLAGRKPTVINGSSGGNTPYVSLPLTNAITGNLVLANGIGYGSLTNGEGCYVSNPGQLSGNIAVMYRSAFCGYAQQVANAQAAGAVAVMLIQNRTNAAEGPFPQEPAVTPYAAIPAVEIEMADGNAMVAALATNAIINVTLTPMDYTVNPPPNNPVLGQDDQGKGATDVQFPVVVQQAGIYPLRLTYWQGNGGGNVEFFTVTGGSRVLINDLTKTTGPGPNGTGLRAWYALATPTISQAVVNRNLVLTFSGILQQSSTLTPGSFVDVPGNPSSPYTVPMSQAQNFYRSRLGQ